MITAKRLYRLEQHLRHAGFGEVIDWSETITPPATAEEFAMQAIYVICNSGMKNDVAEHIYDRCMDALERSRKVRRVFGHPGKSAAIEKIWDSRENYYVGYLIAGDPVAYLQRLPWIGPVTRYHLAKNLGTDVAKPDVHLERIARRDKTSTAKLCHRLACETGYRIATVDTILWRACAERLLNSAIYEFAGWKAAFNPRSLTVEQTN